MDTRVVREGLYFGEGPRWHEGRLWYSDFYDHAVHALAPDGRDERVVEVAAQPSGLGWLPDGRMLIVSMLDRKVLRMEADGGLVTHADLADVAGWHCNDMVVDTQGRAYVGNFGCDFEAVIATDGIGSLFGEDSPVLTVLALVEPTGEVSIAAEGLLFPNGTVITPDGRTLIVGESFGSRLTAFDVHADGRLSGRRVWADLRAQRIAPDGICLDAEGAIWVANAAGGGLVRVAEGGEVLDTIEFSQTAFACMLGGDDGRDLYAVTAPTSNPADVLPAPKGKVEVARVDVPHAGQP
jgi:sugar lactone lactonase YvrE